MAEKLKTIVDRLLTGLLGDAEHAEGVRLRPLFGRFGAVG